MNPMQPCIDRAVDHWKAGIWWKKHAETSANPSEPLEWSKSQRLLAVHILKNLHLYVKTFGKSDWQTYQEATRGDIGLAG